MQKDIFYKEKNSKKFLIIYFNEYKNVKEIIKFIPKKYKYKNVKNKMRLRMFYFYIK